MTTGVGAPKARRKVVQIATNEKSDRGILNMRISGLCRLEPSTECKDCKDAREHEGEEDEKRSTTVRYNCQ